MNQDQDSDDFGSEDAMASAADYAYARQLVQAYFNMLTRGCQQVDCTNMYCYSNPHTTALSATEAAIMSIYLATKAPVPLCVVLDEQQEQVVSVEQLSSPAEDHQLSSTLEQTTNHTGEVDLHEQQQEQAVSVEQLASPAEDHQIKSTIEQATSQTSEVDLREKPLETLEEPHSSNQEEQCPETADIEVPKCEQPENNTIQSTNTSRERNSTPRQRLSTAVQLDQGLNKTRDSPKKPTTITRVIVQPKHNTSAHSTTNLPDTKNVTAPVAEQQHEESPKQAASSAKNALKHRLSRPKQKLFDAIKKSFSRTRKAPLGSA